MPRQLSLLAEESGSHTTQRNETERATTIACLCAMSADPSFRAIEGFPIGENEVILALVYPTRGILYQFQNNRTIYKTADELPDGMESFWLWYNVRNTLPCIVLCRASTALAQRRSPRVQLAVRQKFNSVLTIRP